jgi:Arc/MetJ-type ribon-helix-helix transcriptional regulator
MTIDLTGETEKLIVAAVEKGVSPSAAELVQAAVRQYLASIEAGKKGRYRALRQNIEAAGVPLLDEEGIRQEVAHRRGSCA